MRKKSFRRNFDAKVYRKVKRKGTKVNLLYLIQSTPAESDYDRVGHIFCPVSTKSMHFTPTESESATVERYAPVPSVSDSAGVDCTRHIGTYVLIAALRIFPSKPGARKLF